MFDYFGAGKHELAQLDKVIQVGSPGHSPWQATGNNKHKNNTIDQIKTMYATCVASSQLLSLSWHD